MHVLLLFLYLTASNIFLMISIHQVNALEDVSEVSQARFWELVPGHAIGSLSIQVYYLKMLRKIHM